MTESNADTNTFEDTQEKPTKETKEFPLLLGKLTSKIKIQKIRLFNFLSFDYDEVELNPEFTIITGPNGAGKSSIFQALKFVLGSNNYDGRYPKWADFIRSGQTSAKVQVQFLVNNQEYIIERSVQRDKAPKYSFKEPNDLQLHLVSSNVIREFVAQTRLDPDNVFSFMSQGNIDTIKDFKEETLCNFVEKGIGLDILRNEIINIKGKIGELDRNLNSLLSRKENLNFQLIELEPKLRRLEKKKQLIQRSIDLQNELLWAQRDSILRQIELYKVEITEIKSQQDEINKNISEIDIKLNATEDANKQIQEQNQQVSTELALKKARVEAITTELQAHTTEKNDLFTKLETYKKEIEVLTKKVSLNRNQLANLHEKIEELNQLISETKNTISQLRTEQSALFQEFQTHQAIFIEYEKKNAQLTAAKERLSDIETTYEDLEKKIQQKVKAINKTRQEFENYKWFMEDPTENLQEKMKKLFKTYADRADVLKEDLKQLQYQYEEANAKAEKIKQTIYDKSMPKPSAIQNMMKEIADRKIDCVGPLIDYITYDELYQTAVESIFGPKVLFSFIAKTRDAFAQLTNMAQRVRGFCNIYLERHEKVDALPPLKEVGKNGIFGYLVQHITPSVNDSGIIKVINTVAGNTLVVKDHVVGTDYIQRYNYSGWIVTLDGEQIRPKKLVIEARPFIPKGGEKMMSVAQGKAQLQSLNDYLENNRSTYNQQQAELKKCEERNKLLSKRLGEIDQLLGKYKELQISTTLQDRNVQQRTEIHAKLEQKKQEIQDISKEIDDIKAKLPKESFSKQKRLEEIPLLITTLEEHLNEYEQSRDNQQNDYNTKKLENATLENELNHHTEQKNQIETDLKKQDSKLFDLFQENIALNSQIILIKENLKKIIENLEIFQAEVKQLSQEKDQHLIKNALLQSRIEQNEQYIQEKQDLLAVLQQKISQLGDIEFRGREISEIQNDLESIEKQIRTYADVSDDLVFQKDQIEQNIQQIHEKQEEITREVTAAQDTQGILEKQYYSKFKISISQLEASIMERFTSANLGIAVNLELQGNIEALGLRINTAFDTESGCINYPLSALSGGQRSMVGICLMLSLHQLNPSPFNMYDEVEMFLDPQNAQVVAKLISEIAKGGVQFVILMPDKSKTLLQLANKVVGVSRNGKNGPSTVHYGVPL